MNLAIDIGNTLCKAALFNNRNLVQLESFPTQGGIESLCNYVQSLHFEASILSSVAEPLGTLIEILRSKGPSLEMKPGIAQKLLLDYSSPQTLGADRLAASNAALALYPGEDVLVISAGTCITYDIVDRQGVYRGGAISPGFSMRLKAMHTFTARLPLLNSVDQAELIGKSTETSMLSGAINGALAEVAGMTKQYREVYPELRILISGGDLPYFEKWLENGIFAVPNIVLIGLNEILHFNTEPDANS